jgi:hypothetical protein
MKASSGNTHRGRVRSDSVALPCISQEYELEQKVTFSNGVWSHVPASDLSAPDVSSPILFVFRTLQFHWSLNQQRRMCHGPLEDATCPVLQWVR